MRFVEIRLFGRVQGVGCRMLIASQARAAGLGGWVRNAEDGSVRVRLEGEDGKIKEFIRLAAGLHSPYGVDIARVVQESGGEIEEKEAKPQKTRQQKPSFDILD